MRNKKALNIGILALGVVGAVLVVLMNFLCFRTEVLSYPELCGECNATFSINLFFVKISFYIMNICAVLIPCMIIFVEKNSKYLWGIGFSFVNICIALSLIGFFRTDPDISGHGEMSVECQNALLDMKMGFMKGINMSNIVIDVYLLFIVVAAFLIIYRIWNKEIS